MGVTPAREREGGRGGVQREREGAGELTEETETTFQRIVI